MYFHHEPDRHVGPPVPCAPYRPDVGADHVLTWRCRQQSAAVRALQAELMQEIREGKWK